MATDAWIELPSIAKTWRDPVSNASLLPIIGNNDGDARIALDTKVLYVWDIGSTSWLAIASPGAAIAIDALLGDVSATGPGAVVATVNSVGGSTAANINLATIAANAATSSNTPSTIVKRDGSGNFSAGIISASNLSGTNTGDVTLAAFDASPNVKGASLAGQVLTLQPADATNPGGVSTTTQTFAGDKTFTGILSANSPTFTGIPTAPTAGVGTSTTQLATTAFVLSQGFTTGASGSMPSAYAASTTVVTSATTTYVTAISTTITMTAASAPIRASAVGTFTVTGAVPTIAKMRVSINGVAGQEQLLSLTAVTTDYIGAAQYISANLGPGTYTILFEIARSSGTGTVSFFEGTLTAIGLQGSNSNGITQLTGDVTAGPGSGSQVATIANAAVTGAKIAATTITAANIAAATITNTQIANTTINLTTKVTGTLPVANGGTGLSAAFAAGRVIFSNGTTFAADPLFQYTTANTRFFVGQGGGTGRINGTVSITDPTPNDVAGNFFSRATTNSAVNIQNENTLATIDMTNSGGTTVGANILAEASRGTLVARTQSQSGDTLFSITAHGRTASAYSAGFAATISIETSEVVTDTTNGGEIVFKTTPNGGAASTERMRIKNSGEAVFQKAIVTAQYTTAAKNALTPSAGWVVYDTTLNQLSYYNGTTWVNL